jgi:hypothetical protein
MICHDAIRYDTIDTYNFAAFEAAAPDWQVVFDRESKRTTSEYLQLGRIAVELAFREHYQRTTSFHMLI